ncbi:hypothetical protein JJD41_01890 [Oxynema sp. CENA135]|uniref:Uncharacterized protein n=1 Tax=Oxynema aestuarii AP17 TaxID=2064643 RepID=A0A6H1TRU4_9CYAN|nr:MULTISPECIES: hypothetical protein [Oxynema]MBK4728641.1 hypothetical protein [Oxynema sp. CENA135]QIZ69165.1 hypothetical protein HCG48_19780 [Oxynema aestuarii AP17]RMH74562.1 MAG: hypothetical protein D6680_14405 [Cyanobacteria bacterium J007]
MTDNRYSASRCRYCQHYQIEGRRGGSCHKLGVPVRGDWKTCSLALPIFGTHWRTVEELEKLWLKEPVQL